MQVKEELGQVTLIEWLAKRDIIQRNRGWQFIIEVEGCSISGTPPAAIIKSHRRMHLG